MHMVISCSGKSNRSLMLPDFAPHDGDGVFRRGLAMRMGASREADKVEGAAGRSWNLDRKW